MDIEARNDLPAHVTSVIDQLHAEAAELKPWADRLFDWADKAAMLVREVEGRRLFTTADGEWDHEAAASAGMESISELFDEVAGGDVTWGLDPRRSTRR